MKFSKGAKVFLSFLITVAVAAAVSLTLLVSESYANVHQPKDIQMDCGKLTITWRNNGNNYPIVMSFSDGKGIWQEIPSEFQDRIFFYRVEDGYAAKMDSSHDGGILLHVYKNTKMLNVDAPLKVYTCKVLH